ncbi:MAG: hypothetical protein KIT11_10585 [Fimbriimonadaceae bacterium]|nr:hypothetical protein [Fimbriimonadaceae bacterium]QYK55766.1 MAG: hypothetical protein KF733_12255 [Fimbriimonadaceae bacterium]
MLGALPALAQRGTVELKAFPAMAVADGNSTVTLTAEVRDQNGRLARNGTTVVFETDRGQFRARSVIETTDGFARIALTAPGTAGTAKVRASAPSLSAQASIEVEFVSDPSILSSAKEFIEVASDGRLRYSTQERLMEAEGGEHPAELRYREIEIVADHLQLSVSNGDVRARGAVVKIGSHRQRFREVLVHLYQRKGLGLIDQESVQVKAVPTASGIVPTVGRTRELVAQDIASSGFSRHRGDLDLSGMKFTDLDMAPSLVQARKAVVFPNRAIQFHRASLHVGDRSIMSVPLFELDANNSSPILTEQFFNVSNSSVAVNYPHYLSLEPGRTSLLRFRYGNRLTSGLGAAGGMFMDFEHAWNQGASSDGGLVVSGIGRDDWGANVRHYWQPDARSQFTAQVNLPAHRSLYANTSYNRQLGHYRLNLSYEHGRTLSGYRYISDSALASIEQQPAKLGNLPATVSLGVTAQERRIQGAVPISQQGVDLRMRMDSKPFNIGRSGTLMASYNLARQLGNGNGSAFSQQATLSLSTTPMEGLFVQSTYEYVRDGFTESILGSHRLTTEATFSSGRTSLRGFAGQSLDADRTNLSANFDYRFSPIWRLSYGFYSDRFQADSFLEQTFIIGYRLGFREIGFSYSTRTRRLGLEILGTSFN